MSWNYNNTGNASWYSDSGYYIDDTDISGFDPYVEFSNAFSDGVSLLSKNLHSGGIIYTDDGNFHIDGHDGDDPLIYTVGLYKFPFTISGNPSPTQIIPLSNEQYVILSDAVTNTSVPSSSYNTSTTHFFLAKRIQ